MDIIEIVNESHVQLNSQKEEFNINHFDIDEFIKKTKGKFLTDKFYSIPFLSDNLFNWKSYKRALGTSFNSKPIAKKISHLVDDIVKFQIEEIKNKFTSLEIYSVEQAKQLFPLTRNLTVGTYIRHPKNSSILTPLDNFYSTLAEDKDHELIEVFGKLGAKELTIEECNISKIENNSSINADFNVGSANVKVDLEKKTDKGRKFKAIYSGNIVEIEENLLQNSIWFSDDVQIKSLYNSRKFKQNSILEYTYTSKYTKTFGLNIDIAVKFSKFGLNLKNDFENTSKIERKFTVIFGDK